jgi:hypothetical protein
MREDEIRHAIEEMPGQSFEDFAFRLYARHTFPALIPTSHSHDLGEDAYTAASRIFEHGGRHISLAISKTATLDKIEEDCDRAKSTGRDIEVIVFVTTVGPTGSEPTTETAGEWRKHVKEKYGWDLEVRSLRAVVPLAAGHEYEDLVDQYLSVPPLDDEYFNRIQEKVSAHTGRAMRAIKLNIPGMISSIPRSEIAKIEDTLAHNPHVVLTGSAGTGKSGIAAILAESAQRARKTILLIDSRRLGGVNNETNLRHHFDLKASLVSAIRRAQQNTGCRVIVDQLDNIAGTPAAELIVDVIVDVKQSDSSVECILICRNETDGEKLLVKRLDTNGFVILTSYPITEETARQSLAQIGIAAPSEKNVEMARNLLNLELIGRIREQQPEFDFSRLIEEIDLWDSYIELVSQREGSLFGPRLVAEATRLSGLGLRNPEGNFLIEPPHSYESSRLISWGIVDWVDGYWHHFRHEKLQDYVYASDKAARHTMPRQILREVAPHRSRNILRWMDQMYHRRNSPVREQFLREMFYVR